MPRRGVAGGWLRFWAQKPCQLVVMARRQDFHDAEFMSAQKPCQSDRRFATALALAGFCMTKVFLAQKLCQDAVW
ncbi:MAG: hypothetical protein RR973_03390, partial [Anaerovoracaceae bacterium]